MNSENKGIIVIVGILAVVVLGAFLLSSGGDEDTANDVVDTTPSTVTDTSDDMADDAMMDDEMMDDEATPGMEDLTIVDVAASNEDFSTLVQAVTEAGLVETLSSEGPFTVFAPTNAAFEALPEGTLEAVLADQEQLTSILTYHVVEGEVMAADVVELDTATTVQGQTVDITVDANGNVFVNEAQVVMTDIEASNGVIHVIDAVLLPQE